VKISKQSDDWIVELFFARDEQAISATTEKYGALCRSVARNVLGDEGEAEECANDAYKAAWDTIPPHTPEKLGAYVARLARNIALKRLREKRAVKRGGGEAEIALHELAGAIPSGDAVDDGLAALELRSAIDAFLATLSSEARSIFILRYWHFESVRGIARRLGCTEGKVKVSLSRSREKLRSLLEKEGIWI